MYLGYSIATKENDERDLVKRRREKRAAAAALRRTPNTLARVPCRAAPYTHCRLDALHTYPLVLALQWPHNGCNGWGLLFVVDTVIVKT